jgi:hypothetical protein
MRATLASFQSALAHMVQTGVVDAALIGQLAPPYAAYALRVSQSNNLQVMRGIALVWRQLLLRQTCPLTTSVLHLQGHFEAQTTAFSNDAPGAAMLQQLAAEFLAWIAAHDAGLGGRMAGFELALRSGANGAVVRWPCDPVVAIHAALKLQPLPPSSANDRYETVIDTGAPGGFVVREL